MEIHHGDCLEVMKKLPEKSIDLFVCDLPYGCLTGGGGKEKAKRKEKGSTDSIAGCDWDIKIDLPKLWEQITRLMKTDKTPILMFCNTRFGAELIASNPSWFRYDLVWYKSRGVGFLRANKEPLRSHEFIYVFSKREAFYKRIDIEGDFPPYVGSHSSAKVYNLEKPDKEGYKKVDSKKRCVKSVITIGNESNKKGHPTQKPKELYKWLIERYSNEGDTILDPTAGSFNSVATAHELKRKAIGIEMNKAFFDKFNATLSSSSAS